MEVLKYRKDINSPWTDVLAIRGAKGDKGDKGDQGERGVRGPAGEPGPKGDSFTYADFTEAQLELLRGPEGPCGPKGPKGDAFTYADFTASQLAALKGPCGSTGPQGPQGIQGVMGPKPRKGVDYWTAEDQVKIVEDVIAALPIAEDEEL